MGGRKKGMLWSVCEDDAVEGGTFHRVLQSGWLFCMA